MPFSDPDQPEHSKLGSISTDRYRRLISFACLVLLLLGQYHRYQGGSGLLESVGILGIVATMALMGCGTGSDQRERWLRFCFLLLASIYASLIVVTISRHGLHW